MTEHPYGPRFWLTYLANMGLMVAVSLLFRYADFVSHLGGTEKQIGFITGLGMVGAITARCQLGIAIDRYGAARVWMLSLCLLVACLLGHLTVQSLQPPWIHLLRILYTISLAGSFGASITLISLSAPPNRMSEMIGMLGSSGFVGLAIGPLLGDWLFGGAAKDELASGLFIWASGAALFSLVCSRLATWGTHYVRPTHAELSSSDSPRETSAGIASTRVPTFLSPFVSLWKQVRNYHPGWTLLVGVVMGIGIGMPGTFLSPFATERGIEGLRWFFLPYAIVAFVVRISTRTLADRWGTKPTILLGLSCLATSMVSFCAVTSSMTLLIPATLYGVAHAFLFPATIAEGSQSFPARYRGIATTLMLTMFDIGLLVGQPLFGWTVELARDHGWNGFFVAFSGVAAILFCSAIAYGIGKVKKPII